jgi:hypothetical protein
MHLKHSKNPQKGFKNPPEWLIIVVVLAVISAIVLPAAFNIHLSVWTTIGMIFGGFGLFVLWLQHGNIVDWLRGRRWKNK